MKIVEKSSIRDGTIVCTWRCT